MIYPGLLHIVSSSIILAFCVFGGVTATVYAIRTHKYYGRYTLIVVNCIGIVISVSTYLADVTGATAGTISAMYSLNTVRYFFYTMFTPLLYCLFFEVCRTLLATSNEAKDNTNNDNPVVTNDIPTKSSKTKPAYLYIIYSAYAWAIVICICAIAYCGVFMNNVNDGYLDPGISNLYAFTKYSNWAFVLLAGLVLYFAYQQLRPYIITLAIYLVLIIVSTVGLTVEDALSQSINVCNMDSDCVDILNAVNIIGYVLSRMVGLLALIFATFASAKYWPKPPAPQFSQQQYYVYPATGTSPPPPQQFVMQAPQQAPQAFMVAPPVTTGSSSQVYQQQPQQQYPIVQIPQHQLQQYAGQQQPIIVQLPIMNNQQL